MHTSIPNDPKVLLHDDRWGIYEYRDSKRLCQMELLILGRNNHAEQAVDEKTDLMKHTADADNITVWSDSVNDHVLCDS